MDREEVESFVQKEFPQIQFHGGEMVILTADEKLGEVHIRLSGACHGCGISPMTAMMLEERMVDEIAWVENVTIDFGSF